MTGPDAAGPGVLRVVRGAPDACELAAVTVLLLALRRRAGGGDVPVSGRAVRAPSARETGPCPAGAWLGREAPGWRSQQ